MWLHISCRAGPKQIAMQLTLANPTYRCCYVLVGADVLHACRPCAQDDQQGTEGPADAAAAEAKEPAAAAPAAADAEMQDAA